RANGGGALLRRREGGRGSVRQNRDRCRRRLRRPGRLTRRQSTAANSLEEFAEGRVNAQCIVACRDHRIDLIGRQLEPGVDRVKRLGALQTKLIEADAVDEYLEVATIPVRWRAILLAQLRGQAAAPGDEL